MGPWSDQGRPEGSPEAGSKFYPEGPFLGHFWNPLLEEPFGTSGHPKVSQGAHFDRSGDPFG